MNQHGFWLPIFCLIAFFFKYGLVKVDASKLNDNKTDVHSQLKEYESNTFGDKPISGGAQINCTYSKYGKSCDHKYELCESFLYPLLFILRIECFNINESYAKLEAYHACYDNQFEHNSH